MNIDDILRDIMSYEEGLGAEYLAFMKGILSQQALTYSEMVQDVLSSVPERKVIYILGFGSPLELIRPAILRDLTTNFLHKVQRRKNSQDFPALPSAYWHMLQDMLENEHHPLLVRDEDTVIVSEIASRPLYEIRNLPKFDSPQFNYLVTGKMGLPNEPKKFNTIGLRESVADLAIVNLVAPFVAKDDLFLSLYNILKPSGIAAISYHRNTPEQRIVPSSRIPDSFSDEGEKKVAAKIIDKVQDNYHLVDEDRFGETAITFGFIEAKVQEMAKDITEATSKRTKDHPGSRHLVMRLFCKDMIPAIISHEVGKERTAVINCIIPLGKDERGRQRTFGLEPSGQESPKFQLIRRKEILEFEGQPLVEEQDTFGETTYQTIAITAEQMTYTDAEINWQTEDTLRTDDLAPNEHQVLANVRLAATTALLERRR